MKSINSMMAALAGLIGLTKAQGVLETMQFKKWGITSRRRIGRSAKSGYINRKQLRGRYAPAPSESNFHTYPKHDARVRELIDQGVGFPARQALKEYRV